MRTLRRTLGSLIAAALVIAALPALAHGERGFTARFTQNAQGDIALAANASLTCIGTEPQCPPARAGTGTPASQNNNNARVMSYIDVDGDARTFNSSDATLTLPPGASVLFAGLYFGGRLGGGPGGAPAPDPGARGSALLQLAGDRSYLPVTASQVDEAGDFYSAFADVTDIVARRGAGTYRVANVQLGTGRADSQAGGWSLVVAFRDAASPSRNLSVFDGFQNVGANSAGVTIPLSGFVTPLSGPVRSTIGIVAYDGDRGTTGDAASVNGVGLSDAANPASNLFNSSIARAGAAAADRNPAYPNTLGYDADLFATTGVLANGQTAAQVRLTTSGDAYAPAAVTIATEVFAPRIEATKAVDLAAADLGDELTYTLTLRNTGEDGATASVLTDAIPANTAYVPGSLEIVSGTNAGPKTDAAGDDQAELDAARNRVVVRLGVFANASAGGIIGPGASATVRFRVRVNATGVPVGAVAENRGALAFVAQNTGAADVVQTPAATTALRVPDLSIQKIHQGTYAPGLSTNIFVAVGNEGDGVMNGPTTVRDTLPAGLSLTGDPFGDGWTCAVAGREVTCTYPDPIAPGESPFAIVIPVRVDDDADLAALANTATVSAPGDGNPANDTTTDSTPTSGPEIDLRVEKTVDASRPYDPTRPIEYALRVVNDGPGEAVAVQLTDTLPAAADLVSITPSQGACAGTVCQLGTVPPGGEVTIALVAQLSADASRYPGDATLTNAATVTAAGRDRDPSNDTATADIQTLPVTDLYVDKSFAPAQPLAGGQVTYTFEVGNRRQTADASFIDTIPPGLTDVRAEVTGGTGICDLDLAGEAFGIPAVLCQIPQFESGGRRTITITGTLAPSTAGTPVANVAAISSDTALQISDELADNRDEATFTPGSVDLQVTKALVEPAGPVPVGGEALFRVTVANAGTVAATGVVLSDVLPEGITPLEAPGCAIAGRAVTCGPFTLPPQVGGVLDIRVRAEAEGAARTLTNTASATLAEPDVAPADNAASADVAVGPYSVLAVTKVAGAATVAPGGTAAFTATVRNEGPSPAGGVTLTDVLPDGLRLRSATPSQGTCAAAACDLGDLAAGATATVAIVADVDAGAAGRRVNAVEVAAATPHRPGRAEAPIEVVVPAPPAAPVPPPDLAVDVRAPSRAAVGAAGTWTVAVVNNGPGRATGVTLSAAAAPGAGLAGARLAQVGCGARLPLSCDLGALAAGERRTLALRLRPRAAGRLTLTGSVRAAEAETTQANNSDAASLAVTEGRARLALSLVPDDRTLEPGQRVTFRLTVRNRGRVEARSLRVCHRLPDGLAFSRAPGARLSAVRSCWSLARLAPGASRTYRVTARALAGEGGRALSTAVVTGADVAAATDRAVVRVLQRPASPIVTS